MEMSETEIQLACMLYKQTFAGGLKTINQTREWDGSFTAKNSRKENSGPKTGGLSVLGLGPMDVGSSLSSG